MLDLYIEQGDKRLRCGYTTGSCAAAAAKAAAELLLSGQTRSRVCIDTPKGILLDLDVEDPKIYDGCALCSIRKDSGDDPDITNGFLVVAAVRKIPYGIEIDGGEGVGRVTQPGLDQPVGAAAINSVPRAMIAKECEKIAEQYEYEGGFSVTISIPAGREIARRTFNPRLGIEGGISVIGTTGIVEPMSNEALIKTIELELNVQAAAGRKMVCIAPGNYGEVFSREYLGLDTTHQVMCSNFIGEALDAAVRSGFCRILLVGHIGKLVKLGIGMMNTHSAYGDGRMETLAACAVMAGAGGEVLKRILSCVSTDAALAVLSEAGVLEETMSVLGKRIDSVLHSRVLDPVEVGFICFTNSEQLKGVLTQSSNAEELLSSLTETTERCDG